MPRPAGDPYSRNTADLVDHYRRQGLLRKVCGQGGTEAVYANILRSPSRQVEPSC